MITQLRIDERLIHGQIVTQWSRFLDVSMIVVANDDVAKNDIESKMLAMAVPAGKKCRIVSVEKAIQALKDPRGDAIRMLLICRNPKDAVTLTEALHPHQVNVANYTKGRKSGKAVALTDYVYADPDDIVQFKKLVEVGDEVFSQMIPSTEKVDLKDILKKY